MGIMTGTLVWRKRADGKGDYRASWDDSIIIFGANAGELDAIGNSEGNRLAGEIGTKRRRDEDDESDFELHEVLVS